MDETVRYDTVPLPPVPDEIGLQRQPVEQSAVAETECRNDYGQDDENIYHSWDLRIYGYKDKIIAVAALVGFAGNKLVILYMVPLR